MGRPAPFTGTWDVVSSPDFDEEYLAMEVKPHVRLREEGRSVSGDYQVGLQTGQIDGRRESSDRVWFSFDGMDELEETTGAGTLTLEGDHLTFVLKWRSAGSAPCPFDQARASARSSAHVEPSFWRARRGMFLAETGSGYQE